MSARLGAEHDKRDTDGELRQPTLFIVGLGTRGRVVITTLLVCREEAAERDDRAAGGEPDRAAVSKGCPQLDRGGRAAGVGHLRGDGALPDQLVQRELLAAQLTGNLRRRAEAFSGRPDRLVGLLCVLDLLLVAARRVRDILRAIHLPSLAASCCQRRLREGGRVGTHVRDVAVLVQALCHAHGVLA